jgi:type IV pilus assembly protein PilC
MPTYSYTATDEENKTVRSTVQADTRSEALAALRKEKLHVVSLEEFHRKGELHFGGKVKSKDLVIFTRQLATLVNAGVPLVRSLSTLQMQSESKTLKQQLEKIVSKVEGGNSLADALAEHPKTFSPIYVNMVRAGEEGGILDDVLKRLALQQEKDAAIRSKVKGAMTYPTVILVITAVAFIFLMTSVVPKLGDIIRNIGGEDATLPIYTVAMLAISDFMRTPLFLVFIVVVLPIAIVGFRRYIKTPKGRYFWHSVLLKLPVVKVLITKVAIARFARTFSSLMGAGVSILQSINTTAGAIGNAVIEKELLDSAKAVQGGQQLSVQLEQSKTFPPLVSQMLAVGEGNWTDRPDSYKGGRILRRRGR